MFKRKKAAFFLLILLGCAFMRCGVLSDEKEKKKTSNGADNALVPADWDGLSDWSGSKFEVQTDE